VFALTLLLNIQIFK